MDFTHIKTDKFSFILFENIFEFEEQKSIFKECVFLCDPKKLELTENSSAARRKDGSLKKSNKGLFLEEIYKDRKYSNYLKLYKKPFELLDMNSIAERITNLLLLRKLILITLYSVIIKRVIIMILTEIVLYTLMSIGRAANQKNLLAGI